MDKLRPTKVVLHCAEGPAWRAGKTKEFIGPNCLRQAQAQIGRWRVDAPSKGHGYDKVDFTIEFGFSEPETTYTGRYDMQCDDYSEIGEQVVSELRFYAGEYCPAHMTRERYEEFIAEVGAKDRAHAWLESIDIPHLQR